MKTCAIVLYFAALFPACVSAQPMATVVAGQFGYRAADSVANLYLHHSLNDLNALSYKLTRSLPTEAEKFRAIYKWVCDNIDNDYKLFLRNKRKKEKLKDPAALRAWNKQFSSIVFKDLFDKQRTICTGYAYLIKELALHAGLSCRIIDGYGRTTQSNIGGTGDANHSWNAVRLDKRWYLCDATWSAGAYDAASARYVRNFDDAYFLSDPAAFVTKHYPLDTTWMLLKHKPTLSAFLNGPIVYTGAFKNNVLPLLPATLDVVSAKGETISFGFSTNNGTDPENLVVCIVSSGTRNSFTPTAYGIHDGLLCIDHTFNTKGNYVVHIFAEEDCLFSYNIHVR